MPTLEERVTAIEERLHDYTTWVVYLNGNKYDYANIGYCKAYNIDYLPTEYPSAALARQAARGMH